MIVYRSPLVPPPYGRLLFSPPIFSLPPLFPGFSVARAFIASIDPRDLRLAPPTTPVGVVYSPPSLFEYCPPWSASHYCKPASFFSPPRTVTLYCNIPLKANPLTLPLKDLLFGIGCLPNVDFYLKCSPFFPSFFFWRLLIFVGHSSLLRDASFRLDVP